MHHKTWKICVNCTSLMFNETLLESWRFLTLKCLELRWKGCICLKWSLSFFSLSDIICIQYVYSISSKSMRSKSRRGWTCCRTSSSTSMHSASKTNKSCTHLNRLGLVILQFIIVTGDMLCDLTIVSLYNVKSPAYKCRPILWQFCDANVLMQC